MTTDIDTTMPKAIETLLRHHDRERERILSLVEHARAIEEAIPNPYVCLNGDSLDVHVDDLDTAIRGMAERGYVLRGAPQRIEPHFNGVALYTVRLARRGEDKPRICLVKAISSESQGACRVVQVGTRTVEQPIYELQCEGKEVLQGYADAVRAAEGEGGGS